MARCVVWDLEPDSAEVSVMTGSLIVGIDPGQYGHGVVGLGPDGEEALRERIANEATAIERLVDRIAELAGGRGQALWVIEADGGDGAVLIGELLMRDELVATLTPNEAAASREGRRQVIPEHARTPAGLGRPAQDPVAAAVGVLPSFLWSWWMSEPG
jgi:hypothetical protein